MHLVELVVLSLGARQPEDRRQAADDQPAEQPPGFAPMGRDSLGNKHRHAAAPRNEGDISMDGAIPAQPLQSNYNSPLETWRPSPQPYRAVAAVIQLPFAFPTIRLMD